MTFAKDELNDYSFKNVTERHDIEVYFKKIMLNVTISSNGHGTITPTNTTIEWGSDLNITIEPYENYSIEYIIINTKEETPSNVIELKEIKDNIDIYVRFIRTYTVTTSTDGNGTITETTTVLSGSSITIEFKPNDGYKVKEVLLNGTSKGYYENSYHIPNITDDQTISVIFEPILYTIVLNVLSGNGEISCTGSLTNINHGEERTFNITPKFGWQIDKVYVNDKVVEVKNNSFTIPITGSITIKAVFVEKPDNVLDKIGSSSILLIIACVVGGIIFLKIVSNAIKKNKSKKIKSTATYSQELPYISSNEGEGSYRQTDRNSSYSTPYTPNRSAGQSQLDAYNKPHQISESNNTPSQPQNPSTPRTP